MIILYNIHTECVPYYTHINIYTIIIYCNAMGWLYNITIMIIIINK